MTSQTESKLSWIEFSNRCLTPFGKTPHIFIANKGYIVWRLGTGNNTELLHIRTFEKGRGYGRKLFYEMLDWLKKEPPYYSVFGFTRVGNTEARKFYGTLGFKLQLVEGLYRDGMAIMFWQSYEKLLEEQANHESDN